MHLFSQTDILEHVGPFPTLSSMAVFEMLSEVIRSVEFLGLVALPEFMDVDEVISPDIPVGLRKVGKVFAAVAAGVELRSPRSSRAGPRRGVEGCLVVGYRCARPGMTAQMERVLMAFGFVFILEAVIAILARILFLHLMSPGSKLVAVYGVEENICRQGKQNRLHMTYLNSSSVSNFLGFLGQQSHMK